MHRRTILILASVAMLLIVARAGDALADSFGGQFEVSQYSGGPSAGWLAKITNTGDVYDNNAIWNNEWVNWNDNGEVYTPALTFAYNYNPTTKIFKDGQIGLHESWPRTEYTKTTTGADPILNTIAGITHMYFKSDYTSGSTSGLALTFRQH